MTLSRTGTATYVGEQFVDRVGRYRGELSPERFDDLVRMISKLGFDDLELEYMPWATDMSSYEIVSVAWAPGASSGRSRKRPTRVLGGCGTHRRRRRQG